MSSIFRSKITRSHTVCVPTSYRIVHARIACTINPRIRLQNGAFRGGPFPACASCDPSTALRYRRS